MTFETKKGKETNQQKEKKQKKGCYWNWLVEAEIKTFEAWNKDRKD
ncbi:MAG: hypothetical protein KKD44_23980 [Proteobacteria bacterium]|nr:hypothetical protein [Pseudomonadota bacterium]